MKFLASIGLALVLLTLESVLVKAFGFTLLRIDVSVVVIAFLALRAGTIEGAFAAYLIGYLLDVMSGHPTGLYAFLGLLAFLVGRLAQSLVDVRSGVAFAMFAVATDFGHGLLAVLLNWVGARVMGSAALSMLPLQALLTGLAALLLYPLLRKIDPGEDRRQMGTLR